MTPDDNSAKTILIVDDEPHIRALLAETLEEFTDRGVRLLIADNGASGLEMALTYRPNLILLDVMMPKMNGYDVCEAIKKKHNLTDIYIAMLTAKGQESDKERGHEVGADIYLTKPFDPDEIVAKASEVLGIAV
ncbi:MAG: response regulator [Candidatus Schekmanbacteria bacterium]|nr:response regulator [Candidatus Schekmanbacteria bacterium]